MSLLNLLEALFGSGVFEVSIRVVLPYQCPVRFADVFLGSLS
jgi:hypothetical protein